MTRFVYLAQPIDLAGPDDNFAAQMLIGDVKDALTKAGIGWFDPASAWRVPAGVAVGREIRQVDTWAQARCDATIAIMPDNVPSAGVPIEVDRACQQYDQPTAILAGTERWALPTNPRRAYFGLDAVAAVDWIRDQPGPAERARKLDQIPIKSLHPEAKLPTKTYPDDAGYDLYVSERTTIPAGQFRDVPCGIAIQIPDGFWAMIVGRSSTLRKRELLVQLGVIDVGYRGELFAAVQSVSQFSRTIEVGERLAQLLLFQNNGAWVAQPSWAAELATHERGSNGFGSSGQ